MHAPCATQAGVGYAFWSAFEVMQEIQALKSEATDLGVEWLDLRTARHAEKHEAERAAAAAAAAGGPGARPGEREDPRIRVIDADELLELLEAQARAAVAAAGPDDPRAHDQVRVHAT